MSKGFPISIQIKQIKHSIFKNKDYLRKVDLSVLILDEIVSQEFVVYFLYKDERKKIYSDTVKPGHTLDLEFELEYGGAVEVYLSDKLVLKKDILDESDSN